MYFTHSHKIIFVTEFFKVWKVPVLLAVLERQVRISDSVRKLVSLLLNVVLSSGACDSSLTCLIDLFFLFLDGLLLLSCLVS